ncbi:hypothetical protein ILUMI_22424 [Ignelater luminosus]|uniref:DUF7869 domain-containing protein n=1 Tax=Ignelater luminosus TaxID=2038154 RepID=A0A8K0CA75_IGNLU|nr:hypothetical protein ILUMI_22424 [Ignelater luminosus]
MKKKQVKFSRKTENQARVDQNQAKLQHTSVMRVIEKIPNEIYAGLDKFYLDGEHSVYGKSNPTSVALSVSVTELSTTNPNAGPYFFEEDERKVTVTGQRYFDMLRDFAIPKGLTTLTAEKELHLRKADAFFDLKRRYKAKAETGEIECLTLDFMQNLPLPYDPSNLAFYARQLWYYVFGIHNLGSKEATIYTYHEGIAKKESNVVTSMLLQYIINHEIASRRLVLISDDCPGQNKNHVMVYFLYFLVHVLKLFDSILYIFPVRGHSCLSNDQDFSLIEKKKRRMERVEVPEEWDKLTLKAREKPSLFDPRKLF